MLILFQLFVFNCVHKSSSLLPRSLLKNSISPLNSRTISATTAIWSNTDDDSTTCIDGAGTSSRRLWFGNTAATMASILSHGSSSMAVETTITGDVDVLPSALRDYTKLAPLGPKETTNTASAIRKAIGLAPDAMARRLANDLVNGATGKGGYFISGDLSKELFRDDCIFEDPTNRVDTLSQYQKALTLLFDPDRSTVELLGDGLKVIINEESTTITGRLRSRGYLGVLPWKPYVTAYETDIVYTLDPKTGLVTRQDQTWTKAASKALQETFTPPLNGEPPRSTLSASQTEPAPVTRLFETLNGRRPYEYSLEERAEIDYLIEQIAGLGSGNTEVSLEGTWVLTYLQPGPGGTGIDRRVPLFPELNSNDNFQRISSRDGIANEVTNIGQILGSWADVRVSGSLREITTVNDIDTAPSTKRRFEATINGGKLCVGAPLSDNTNSNCPIDLPMIKGTGIFDSIYLGDRLRIGQNINGGGARVVQIRL